MVEMSLCDIRRDFRRLETVEAAEWSSPPKFEKTIIGFEMYPDAGELAGWSTDRRSDEPDVSHQYF